MSDPKRPPDELVAASAHLRYEVWMFDTTARALMSGVFGESAARNAFLESFTIHTRLLLQFFHPSGSEASDILAEHFFDDRMTWLRLRGGVPKVLADVEQRVGTEIAHLSYDRLLVGPEARDWNVPDIWEALMGLVDKFVANVPRALLSEHWSASVPTPTDIATWSTGSFPGRVSDIRSLTANQTVKAGR